MVVHNLKNTFVAAFFDILGFKSLLLNNEHDTITSLFTKLNNNANAITYELIDKSLSNPQDPFSKDFFNLGILSLSDSIVIWTHDNKPINLFNLLVYSNVLLSLTISEGFPLRGAISCGDISILNHDETKYKSTNLFGNGIVKAYNLEKIQDWSGCIIDSEVIKKVSLQELFNQSVIDKLYIEYEVPLSQGRIEKVNVLNWPMYLTKITHQDVINSFSMHNKETSDWAVRRKIRNTVDFFSYCRGA